MWPIREKFSAPLVSFIVPGDFVAGNRGQNMQGCSERWHVIQPTPAPKEVTTADIYRGAIPFILMQVLMVTLLLAFPKLITL